MSLLATRIEHLKNTNPEHWMLQKRYPDFDKFTKEQARKSILIWWTREMRYYKILTSLEVRDKRFSRIFTIYHNYGFWSQMMTLIHEAPH